MKKFLLLVAFLMVGCTTASVPTWKNVYLNKIKLELKSQLPGVETENGKKYYNFHACISEKFLELGDDLRCPLPNYNVSLQKAMSKLGSCIEIAGDKALAKLEYEAEICAKLAFQPDSSS